MGKYTRAMNKMDRKRSAGMGKQLTNEQKSIAISLALIAIFLVIGIVNVSTENNQTKDLVITQDDQVGDVALAIDQTGNNLNESEVQNVAENLSNPQNSANASLSKSIVKVGEAVSEILNTPDKAKDSAENVIDQSAKGADSTSEKVADEVMAKKGSELDICRMNEFGVQFKCNLRWEMQPEENRNFIVISSKPKITLSFDNKKDNVRFLSQISKMYLEETNQYVKGFRTEEVDFANRKAVLVKAFDADNPQKRIVDYYYIHDSQLYGVNFALDQEHWEDGKYIIKELASSFQPL